MSAEPHVGLVLVSHSAALVAGLAELVGQVAGPSVTIQAVGGTADCRVLAAAVEVIHAYSLVHDDLPCMDDDDVRRGRPTVHRAYGVPVAACAGLAMVPLAVRCAYRGALVLGLPPTAAADIVRELMRAAGAGGMIGGQLLDLEAEGVSLPLDELERVHRAKTGALIVAAADMLGGERIAAQSAMVEAFIRFPLAAS